MILVRNELILADSASHSKNIAQKINAVKLRDHEIPDRITVS
jgi:hypothetical protein